MIENSILAVGRQGRKALVFGLSFPSTELVEYAARLTAGAARPHSRAGRSPRIPARRPDPGGQS